MITEIWKPVLHNPHMEVSNLGRIKRLKGKNKGIQGHFCLDKDGYCKISVLNEFGKWTQTSVHRVVAIAFIPNPNNKPQVNHIDGNRQNNQVSNLEWVTSRENVLHSFTKGNRKKCTEVQKNRILTQFQIDNIDKLRQYYTVAQIAKLFNIEYQSLKNVIHKMKKSERLDNQQPSQYSIY